MAGSACTIGSDGCLLACFTMLARSGDVAAMNTWRKNRGGYAGALATTFGLLDFVTDIRLAGVSERYQKTAYPDVAKYHAHLAAGNPAILEVNWYRRFRPLIGWALYSMHFVLALPNGEIYDPWPEPIGDPYDSVCKLSDYGRDDAEAIVRAVYYENLPK